jgi:hypothetical protein
LILKDFSRRGNEITLPNAKQRFKRDIYALHELRGFLFARICQRKRNDYLGRGQQ